MGSLQNEGAKAFRRPEDGRDGLRKNVLFLIIKTL